MRIRYDGTICEWRENEYVPRECKAQATAYIEVEMGRISRIVRVPVCAAHQARHDAGLVKWKAQEESWRKSDRNNNHLQWVCVAFGFAVESFVAGPVITFLTLIAGLLLYWVVQMERKKR
jgi:hypothetical protein